jgi:hypothetical protein
VGKRSSSFRPTWKVWFARSSSPHRLCKGWINLSSLRAHPWLQGWNRAEADASCRCSWAADSLFCAVQSPRRLHPDGVTPTVVYNLSATDSIILPISHVEFSLSSEPNHASPPDRHRHPTSWSPAIRHLPLMLVNQRPATRPQRPTAWLSNTRACEEHGN